MCARGDGKNGLKYTLPDQIACQFWTYSSVQMPSERIWGISSGCAAKWA